ncbi:PREDICTED: uncharacterized protein LOC107098038 [Cyprinodon variegatus]|uniref:Uncharacterized LOC107098038 n=1 Tax=Cyprinodon variegatus TaxID=28743 RepID=A0A3Q2DJE0_CYPVA|nr:PREDICTED: uncharacterized protein LOC107098038 [Cyprinodon variegatus]XP_015250955.1 PREDICTED: uncharacterized protein LOC107098038 [Cyprinodon variegatus]
MLSRPPTLTETNGRGCDPAADPASPLLPVADAGRLSPPPPPAAPPCCSCASLLPRLLAAHRMEVRRLLRGALSSLGRRLDSLERRSRKQNQRRKKQKESGEGGSPAVVCSSASSFTSAPSSDVIISSYSPSSSSSSDVDSSPPTCSFSQSEQSRRSSEEQEVRRRRKRRRHEGSVHSGRENDEEEEERFVGQMAVSYRGGGAEGEPPILLLDLNQRKRRRREGGASQSEKSLAVAVRKNGFSSVSQHAVLPLPSAVIGQTCDQSEVISFSRWTFSDIISHLSLHQSCFDPRLPKTTFIFNPAAVLHLSAAAMETALDWVKGGVCWSPLRPLRDWTAPPSLSTDHCYMRRQSSSPAGSVLVQHTQRSNHSTWSLRFPRRRASALPLCSANGLSAALPANQSANLKLSKRVSQIRIRRASPRETPLTPMGLPKVKRLKKKEFSLEEIYTNKNYESPPSIRSLETIFEEPREKDGALLLVGQQKRRRLLLFPDFTQPRKRKKPQGVGLPVSLMPRKRTAVRRQNHGGGSDDGSDLDVMLVERLSELEHFLTQQGLDV